MENSKVPSCDGTQSGKPHMKFSTHSVHKVQTYHRPAVTHPAASGSALSGQPDTAKSYAALIKQTNKWGEERERITSNPALLIFNVSPWQSGAWWQETCFICVPQANFTISPKQSHFIQYIKNVAILFIVAFFLCSICDLLSSYGKKVFL